MEFIDDIAALEALYPDPPNPRSLIKVARQLTPLYREWIAASKFCVIATVGPDGTDASPRGDDGPVVQPLSDTQLALPDWRGNNRLDSLRNIVADGRISVMFMVAGSANVVRVNGTARLTADAELCARFVRGKIQPKSVIVTEIGEVYFQCAKSILRSGLWNAGEVAADVPSAGAFLREVDDVFDAESYDRGYADYADCTKW